MTTPISTCRCCRACLTGAAVDTKLSATLFNCLAAPCPDGLQRFLFPLIPYGAPTRRAPSARARRCGPAAGESVHIAKLPNLNAEGAERARGSTEAFLYRRLENIARDCWSFPAQC